MPPPAGCAPYLGRLQRPQARCPRPTQRADRFSVDGRPRHGGAVPGAPEPGPLPGLTPVGVDAGTGFFRPQGGGDAPADVAWFHQGAREPRAAGIGVVDEAECLALRPQLPATLLAITLPGPDGAEGDHRGTMGWGDLGDGDGLLMAIHANVERARLCHGGPPRRGPTCGRQEAVRVSVSAPARHSGAAYPSEVIMSRHQ
jgi:hypothetical protein